jgi:protein disulfide-isomerase-like protein
MRLLAAAVAVLALGALAVSASDVLILTPDNFDQEVGGSNPVFVEFFAPWCGHCKSLAPEYEIVASAFKGQPVKIASVDADKHRDLGGRFGVTGFPSLKFFPANTKEPEAYSGGRTAADIMDFVNKKTGTNAKVKSAPTAVVVLDDDNFDSIVKDPTKDVLVEFYAPWCGHCKQLTPKYEQVGATFEGDTDVVIAKIDADKYKKAASEYGVSGYPTLKFFPKGNKDGEDYAAGREAADFVKFINDKTGSQRVLGGGYTETAGRDSSLDELAVKFMAASSSERASILEQTQAAVKSNNGPNKEYAKFYEINMKRIIEKGNDFAKSEASRLKRVVDSGSVAANKRADFYKRINIANAFNV